MATEPTIMKMRLKEINRIVSGIPNTVRSAHLEEWEAWFERGKTELANALRQELNNLPKGYVRSEPSLKTQAKKRFLMWRENQAMAEWKKLSESERAVWEGYVQDGLEFGTIREKELARTAEILTGDRVVLVKGIWYLNNFYPAGSAATVQNVVYDDVLNANAYVLCFDSEKLHNLNAYPHEIKKEGK